MRLILKVISIIAFNLLLTVSFAPKSVEVAAQCAMCKKNLESGISKGEPEKRVVGSGINQAIMFLLSFPYLAVGTVGVMWYFRYKRQKRQAALITPPA
jgi:hypothetical protein